MKSKAAASVPSSSRVENEDVEMYDAGYMPEQEHEENEKHMDDHQEHTIHDDEGDQSEDDEDEGRVKNKCAYLFTLPLPR